MHNPTPKNFPQARITELEAHVRLLDAQLEHAEILRQRWKLIALMGWALGLGLLGAMIFGGEPL